MRLPYQKTLIAVCLLGFLLCMALIFSGCALKQAQITHVGLHAADLGSTAYAESHGAVEANPIMTNWPVRIALKAATSALVIWGTNKLSREHQTLSKVVLHTINAVLGAVVVNNLRVAKGTR